MPRAPSSAQDSDSFAAYRTAWRATKKLLREGRSFSGHERNCAFLNCRAAPFANVSAVTGLDFADDGRAIGVTDWDQDGDLDLWIANRTGPRLRLMRNQTIGRRDGGAGHNFVALRLRGTVSNRDAIGARVSVLLGAPSEAAVPAEPAAAVAAVPAVAAVAARPSSSSLIQTVTAGDAYLSQSSKWLHFGLGQAATIQRIAVRWPNGMVEQFTNVQPGHRYQVVEGSGQAVPIDAAPRTLALTPAPQPAPEPSEVGRTFFSNRLPLPLLRYRSWDTDDTHPIDSGGRPLLITLWASWCGPCVSELQTFAQQAAELRAAGLQVVALTVDGLDQSNPTQPADARVLLRRMQFPFASGVATRELLDKLQVAEGLLLNHQPALAVPASFLVDGNGQLAVFYQGPVERSQLLTDLQQLDASPTQRRDLAAPLAGRWLAPPRQLLLRAVARTFRDAGYEEDYTRYLQLDAQAIDARRSQAVSDDQRRQLDAHYAAASFDLGLALLSTGEASEAMEHFRRAVQLQPDHVDALTNLGALLARGGRAAEAIAFLQRAVAADAGSLPARTNLAAALVAEDRFADAVTHYEWLVEADPSSGPTQAQLGRVYLELGRAVEAVPHLRRAVELNPRDVAAPLSLAWLLSTNPDDALRNADQAIGLAERLKSLTAGRHPLVLDVLAAAYAEQGQFAQALATLDAALQQIGSRNPSLRQALLARRAEYEAQQPHRDPDGKYP